MEKSILLVPTDFTSVGECATEHAVRVAKDTGDEIILLHVVEKKEDADAARKKIEDAANKVINTYGIPTKGIVRIGNIFDDIGDAASELAAKLIFMGTHGKKGIQHLTGSYALKVITNSAVPFIVVQETGPKPEGYDDIVLPLDLSKETKQKLKIAAEVGKYFNSKIHIVAPEESDEFLKNQLSRNIAYSKKYLNEHGLEFTTNTVDSGSFSKEVILFAGSVGADLICIMNMAENSIMGVIGSAYEQAIITNKHQIPTMIVNPRATSNVTGRGMFAPY